MRRLLTEDGHFGIVALDQRAILGKMLAERKGIDEMALPFADMLDVKRLLVETLSANASAMLFDPNIAVPAALHALPRHTGLLVSLEHHRVEESPLGRKTASIPNWSVEKIQRLGADGVKVLIWYHPEADSSICEHQQNYIREVGQQCAEQQLPFVLELLAYQPPPSRTGASIAPYNTLDTLPEVVLCSVQEFTRPEYQVDLLKLESPVPVDVLERDPGMTQVAFDAIGQCCSAAGIPWVLLSAGVTTDEFATVLKHAYAAGAQGFLAGRAIWKEPLSAFPDLAACQSRLSVSGGQALSRLLELTRDSANAFQPHHGTTPVLEAEGDFARNYPNPVHI